MAMLNYQRVTCFHQPRLVVLDMFKVASSMIESTKRPAKHFASWFVTRMFVLAFW
jgi:hypothetical protein